MKVVIRKAVLQTCVTMNKFVYPGAHCLCAVCPDPCDGAAHDKVPTTAMAMNAGHTNAQVYADLMARDVLKNKSKRLYWE